MQNTLTEKAAEMAEQALVVKALVRIPSGLADARTLAAEVKRLAEELIALMDGDAQQSIRFSTEKEEI